MIVVNPGKMITREKIEIYKYYSGDVDKFSRANGSHEKVMSDEDFFLIARIVQDLVIIKNGLAAKDFQNKTEKCLLDNCDDQETINLLKSMAWSFS